MATDINTELIKELVSVSFNTCKNRIELIDLYESLYGGKLCRTCRKDREFAYNKLKEYAQKSL